MDPGSSHQHKAEKRFALLSKIDEACLNEAVDKQCKDLMTRFFPEIQQLSDVRGYRPEDTRDEE